MKCKNKEVKVRGAVLLMDIVSVEELTCIITNDEQGKTLSIDNDNIQFTIPFEPIEKYLKGDYRK